MKQVGIFTITSAIQNKEQLEQDSQDFLKKIEKQVEFEFVDKGSDFSSFGSYDLNLIFIRTGGTEGSFKQLYPTLKAPFYLLTSGTNNSLAASMEILSFLRQQNEPAEILHGDVNYIGSRIDKLTKVSHAIQALQGMNLGVVGKPSDWLISSDTDYAIVKEKLGINLVDITAEEFMQEIERKEYPEEIRETIRRDYDEDTLTGALYIYGALHRLITKYQLSGLTVRCFDLLGTVHNTGCLALALLNSQGFVGTCEGDIPAMLSMVILKTLTGKSGFQANPSSIDTTLNEMVFAHCTVPFNMIESYTYHSHFESGLGVAIRGIIPIGNATIFKTSGNLEKRFVSDAKIINNLASPNLCRTQIRIRPEKSVQYFLTESIGNHHIITTGCHSELIEEFYKNIPSR